MDIDIQGTEIKPDPRGNVELTRFGSTAILFCGGDEPFMVVKGYDGKTGEWTGDSVRVDDLSVAWDIADPEIIEGATVKWKRSDVAGILEDRGIEANHTVSRAELRNGIMASPVESTFESILTSLEVKKLIEFDSYGNVAIA